MKASDIATPSLLALTWNHHQRMTQLCAFLNVPLEEITTKKRGIIRYLYLASISWRFLYQHRPSAVLIQSPSLILALFCVAIKHLFRFRLVVDAHNESVEPFINKSKFIRFATNFVLKSSELVIVTNKFLAEVVKTKGGVPFILPDRIPEGIRKRRDMLPEAPDNCFSVAVICTGAPDEPISEILNAARMVGKEISFYVTGNIGSLLSRLGDLPENVTATGFLEEDDYWDLLRKSDSVLDLTRMPDCLVCGAYEALAVETPMILTKNRATKNLFGECAVLIENNAPDIVRAIYTIRNDKPAILEKLNEYRKIYLKQWEENALDLKIRLAMLSRS